ncbi:MAG TPA: EscU/YscU/HrcU family type III secretion system export apparatus switch protein [Ideonella sp.]|uniref:EscU/YscU/HrcU family type III secretion system export apparatus switch protein n=1 Tax=Ideonella sp. TaxID=1929293 RepID=UPI002E322B55|nr:EscU/YscU/HrcU family type III secretion system export apparatus switch protein [Ideonella sp.]HEX5682640.1 EscU/YscU/HrcU family type III secretion system export apparatus switch protein [Ideonella sp.]
MSSEQDLDRNEAATPHKLDEARKKGQVAKSADMVSALVFTVGAVALYAKGWEKLVELFRFDHHLMGFARAARGGPDDGWRLWDLAAHVVQGGLVLVLPAMGALMIAGILANIGQTGPIWSWHPVKPDWNRLNPMNGFKRVMSLRTLFDAFRALVKLTVLGVVVGSTVRDMVPHFGQLGDVTPYGHAGLLLQDLGSLALRVALALCVIALLDYGYTQREFAKNMRMSRREMRDESKNRDGDPRIRARLRELRREMLKRSLAVQRTAQADVVITNPTHIAVALRYKHGEMAAPVLVSKGAGALAAMMRLIAARHRVPVLRSPALARALHAKTRLDAPIPTELYPDVARLMVWVLNMKAARRATMDSRA